METVRSHFFFPLYFFLPRELSMKTVTWCGLLFVRTVILDILITDLAIDTLRFYMKHENSRNID